MGSVKPSSRYASVDSHSSSNSSHHSDPSPSRKHSSLRRLISNSGIRCKPSDPIPDPKAGTGNSSRAIVRTRSGDVALGKATDCHNFGSMVRKFMEKRSGSKPGSNRMALALPADAVADDLRKAVKGSNLSALSKKLFQKGGSGERTAGRALTEVKNNTRTLAMVLRSERELLSQNKEYEEEISEFRLLIEEKNREVEKLKDLCLKQREEIKALKDAILFPDVMNSQMQELLEKQGCELKQAKQLIPSLQKQVTSLTGQLQCLAEDLAEVKADKYIARACFDGHISSPRTPVLDQEPLGYSSGEPVTSEYGSPDEMFLKDLNPCLTPCFSKRSSKEYDEVIGCESLDKYKSSQNSIGFSQDMFSSCRSRPMSKSSDHHHPPSYECNNARKMYKSDEDKWSTGRLMHQNLS
ncbi:uncharacterized protein [Typha latifolia]|uniref:uncharacterized protein n=1 Tax=Typha latifolia TaxID=4733 RepID=UPI003C2B81C3